MLFHGLVILSDFILSGVISVWFSQRNRKMGDLDGLKKDLRSLLISSKEGVLGYRLNSM